MRSLELKAARIKKGFNQENMAEKMNMAVSTYCNKENGVKANFTIEEITEVAEILDLNANQVNEIFFDGKLTNVLSQIDKAS